MQLKHKMYILAMNSVAHNVPSLNVVYPAGQCHTVYMQGMPSLQVLDSSYRPVAKLRTNLVAMD